jgi:hypothetical protein
MKSTLLIIIFNVRLSRSFIIPRFMGPSIFNMGPSIFNVRPYFYLRSQIFEQGEIKLPPRNHNNTFFSKKTFSDIGLCSTAIKDALKRIRIETPSRIQALSFKSIYEGRDAIVADQTGSGFILLFL